MKKFAALIFVLFAHCAVAYSPASGLWFNPNESGRGYTIDFQNGVMVVTPSGNDPANSDERDDRKAHPIQE